MFGTDELTLSDVAGVMRFLQIQWHTHERERNAWDIERAEMKAKIAKQEGECRHAKHLNDQLSRQIRMLEQALKNERAKAKALKEGKESSSEEKKSDKEGEVKAKDKPERISSYSSFPRRDGLWTTAVAAWRPLC